MDIETKRTLELMLKYYEENSFAKTYWGTNWKRLFLYHGMEAAAFCIFFWLGEFIVGSIFLGSFIGTVSRDIGYFRSAKRSRPIYDMVTDYDKVKRLLQESE
jgi:O-antigen/teichoic acid export membrane protein